MINCKLVVMENKKIFEAQNLVMGGYINTEGDFQCSPYFVSTEYFEINKRLFEDVIKKEVNPIGANFGLYNKHKEIIKERVIINGELTIIYAVSNNSFPEWKDEAAYIRISRLESDWF